MQSSIWTFTRQYPLLRSEVINPNPKCSPLLTMTSILFWLYHVVAAKCGNVIDCWMFLKYFVFSFQLFYAKTNLRGVCLIFLPVFILYLQRWLFQYWINCLKMHHFVVCIAQKVFLWFWLRRFEIIYSNFVKLTGLICFCLLGHGSIAPMDLDPPKILI